MSEKTLTVTELVRLFSDYVSRAASRHDSSILCRGNKRVAELRPVPAGRRLGDLPDLLRSLPRLSEKELNAPWEA